MQGLTDESLKKVPQNNTNKHKPIFFIIVLSEPTQLLI